MSDEKSFSVVHLGNSAKPVDTFVKKISKAVGGIFEPYQKTRIAEAEAKAELIKAKSDIEITDLYRRADHRCIEEEAIHQENIEGIIKKAISKLKDQSDPSKMDVDWIANFFQKSRIVSDAEMQELWASILAGEANSPGSYSKRTVNFLEDMDKKDAEYFAKLCRFGWQMFDEFTPLIFNYQNHIYKSNGINFPTLSHLESIGLIHQEHHFNGYVNDNTPKRFTASYFGRSLNLDIKKQKENKIEVGQVILTKVGLELASICHTQEVDGFFDYVKEKWKLYLPEQKN